LKATFTGLDTHPPVTDIVLAGAIQVRAAQMRLGSAEPVAQAVQVTTYSAMGADHDACFTF
jgi:hypothetical protein